MRSTRRKRSSPAPAATESAGAVDATSETDGIRRGARRARARGGAGVADVLGPRLLAAAAVAHWWAAQGLAPPPGSEAPPEAAGP